eukprot:749133-Hanusia_phi.AAC.2
MGEEVEALVAVVRGTIAGDPGELTFSRNRSLDSKRTHMKGVFGSQRDIHVSFGNALENLCDHFDRSELVSRSRGATCSNDFMISQSRMRRRRFGRRR